MLLHWFEHQNFPLISWCWNFIEMYSLLRVSGDSPEISRNCAFPQNFHTWKLGINTVFYEVLVPKSLSTIDRRLFYSMFNLHRFRGAWKCNMFSWKKERWGKRNFAFTINSYKDNYQITDLNVNVPFLYPLKAS